MKKRNLRVVTLSIAIAVLSACGGGGSVQEPPPPMRTAASITADRGTPQSAGISTTFAVPLVASVVDSAGSAVSGAVVTFTPPTSGASGAFAGGADTATTNENGVATAPAFTANGTLGAYIVEARVAGVANPAYFNLTNIVGPPASITASSGTPQSAAISTTFISPLVVQVMDSGGNAVSGAVVTFTPPSGGASIAFASGVSTATTNASGVATSTTFTANGTAGGPYTVAATVAGVATAANFSLTNAAPGASSNYSFYLGGLEGPQYGTNPYGLAGSVTIDVNGYVLVGEQDYKDDWHAASPQPSGDVITGGALAVNSTTGQGMLTLVTNDSALGANGVETIGVQFVNNKHALIIQFDGSATSSGSMDLQAAPSALNGSFSFTLLGTDGNDYAASAGGVFSISGTSLTSGVYDYDANGTTVVTGIPFTGAVSPPDSFGRGTITVTNTNLPSAINYYIVGPEAIRIIVVGPGLVSGIGSAFGQGSSAGTFSNASLASSVFGVESNAGIDSYFYAAIGMFTTIPGAGTFQGVADNDEEGAVASASPISGTYNIASNGYGSLTIAPGDLLDVSALGIYMTDPRLNLNDPNNTTTGLGGALIADLDPVESPRAPMNGTGFLVPQTDTSTSSFGGNYAFGMRNYNQFGQTGWEVDFLGQGTVTNGVFTGTGLVNNLSGFFFLANPTDSGTTFAGTVQPDMANVGRYTMAADGLAVTLTGWGTYNYRQIVIYQANGGLLLWMDEELSSLFFGSFQQQTSLAGIPGAK